MDKKSTYIVESPVTHDRPYLIGEEISLTEAEAKPLLAARAVATPDMASAESKEAVKARTKEAAERESAAARAEYDHAKAESEDADRALKEATAKAEDAKKRADAAKQRLGKMKSGSGSGAPHTWEQDADKLGSEQLSPTGGTAAGEPAKAPGKGSKMTPSSPTQEAIDNQ